MSRWFFQPLRGCERFSQKLYSFVEVFFDTVEPEFFTLKIIFLWTNLPFFAELPSRARANGEYFRSIQASRWHVFYLFSGQRIPRMLQGEVLVFCCTFVSLKETIYLPVYKFWYTYMKYGKWIACGLHRCICRWYIPDLIRLANDIETNPGPAVVDNTDSRKTICAPQSSSNIPSSLSNR